MEKWEDRKDLIFPHVCLVGGVEKWEGEKHFCLVGEKNWKDRKNLVCPHVCLVGGVEKWEGKKHFFFFWLKKK